MLDYLPAITLHRPHPWAIFHPPKKPKDHENRGYALPEKYLGEWVAMHAGKRYNEVAAADMRVAGYGPVPSADDDPTGIIGLVKFDHVRTWDGRPASPWFTGPYGWHIADRLVLDKPIHCLGKQGFWKVPPGAASFLREKINTAGVTP